MAFDPNDPRLLLRSDVLDDPRPFYDWLRSEAPVWRVPGQDTYLVSDPSQIRETVRRTDDFSSNLVSILHDDGSGCPVAYAMAPFGDPIHVLSTADPPLHARHRRLLQSHLSPATVSTLEPAVTGIVDEHLDQLLDSSHVDFVTVFGDPVPARTICEVIGRPDGDAPRIVMNVSGVGALLDGVTRASGMGPAAHAAMDLIVYVQQEVDAALGRPVEERSGLLAVFAKGIESGAVTADEARDMLLVLVSAGSETTASPAGYRCRDARPGPRAAGAAPQRSGTHSRRNRGHPAYRRTVPVPLPGDSSRHCARRDDDPGPQPGAADVGGGEPAAAGRFGRPSRYFQGTRPRTALRVRQRAPLLHRCPGRPPRGPHCPRAAPRPDGLDHVGRGTTADPPTEHLHSSIREPSHRRRAGLRAGRTTDRHR